ncbi:MAG: hypothetical protein C0408_09180 [Odoribacter sp.]|nr:hypothetical protein [Odoribacter sp.]
MSLLVETIRAENGKLLNIGFHNERLIRSLHDISGVIKDIDLGKIIAVPETAAKGIFKCRVVYDTEIRKIEFIPYIKMAVTSLKLIEDNEIDYSYKFIDRTAINRLMSLRDKCDDIIIVKNGYITDSSYANLIFRDRSGNWVTPSTCLLPGTRRANLLKNRKIKMVPISVKDISNFSEVKLINAMIGMDDTEGILIGNIVHQRPATSR